MFIHLCVSKIDRCMYVVFYVAVFFFHSQPREPFRNCLQYSNLCFFYSGLKNMYAVVKPACLHGGFCANVFL